MRLFALAAIFLFSPAAAQPLSGASPAYSFGECVRPAEPDLAIDGNVRGKERIAANNEAIRRFNAHIEAVNIYFDCLGAAAQRDIDAHVAAVNSALTAEQESVQVRLRDQRRFLEALS